MSTQDRDKAAAGVPHGDDVSGTQPDVPGGRAQVEADHAALHDLDRRLKAVRGRESGVRSAQSRQQVDGRAMSVGFRIVVELAAGIVVGTAIGIGLDRWLGTKPWLMILFFILGCGASFMTVYRTALELDRTSAAAKTDKRQADDPS